MPIDIGLDELDRLLASGATLIEVLPANEYRDEHLPGAINVPLKTLDEQTASVIAADRPVIVYCWDSL